MSDTYLQLVNSGVTKHIAKRLGLPRPATLRRTDPDRIDQPLIPGPVVVLGSSADADTVANALLDWDLDVRRSVNRTRVGAIILVLSDITDPGQVSASVTQTGALLRSLAPGGRVLVISRTADAENDPAVAAARHGLDGFTRSLAKELRAGATGNGVALAGDVEVSAPSALGAIRFLLSARSSFVNGQVLPVTTTAGALPDDWARPLDGQVAVVTGAARGIGAEIARVLHREGAVIVGVDVPAAGEALATVMNDVGGTALQVDITADNAAERIIERCRQRHGRLDIVVHNAGILRDKLLANMKPEQWDAVIAVNLMAQLRMNEAFLAADLSPDGLRLIGLASTSGIAGNRGQTNYSYSKAGVIGMTRALAPRVAANSGTANAVAPGFIETEMTAKMPAVQRQVARRLSSLQQGGQPVDVAEAVSFLASPQSAGINGAVLRVCGQHLVGQ